MLFAALLAVTIHFGLMVVSRILNAIHQVRHNIEQFKEKMAMDLRWPQWLSIGLDTLFDSMFFTGLAFPKLTPPAPPAQPVGQAANEGK